MKEITLLKSRYKRNGYLIFRKSDNLRKICKAIPEDLCGVYIYTIKENGKKRIIYIGCSGKIENGMPVCRQKGGLRRRICGKQGNVSRDTFYKKVMEKKGVSEIKIYWFDTEKEDPEFIEYDLILNYIIREKEFPEFNNKLERKENKAIKDFDSVTKSK